MQDGFHTREFDMFWEDMQVEKCGPTIGDVLAELERLETDFRAAELVRQTFIELRAKMLMVYVHERSRPPTPFVTSMVAVLTQHIDEIGRKQKTDHDKVFELHEEAILIEDEEEHEREVRGSLAIRN